MYRRRCQGGTGSPSSRDFRRRSVSSRQPLSSALARSPSRWCAATRSAHLKRRVCQGDTVEPGLNFGPAPLCDTTLGRPRTGGSCRNTARGPHRGDDPGLTRPRAAALPSPPYLAHWLRSPRNEACVRLTTCPTTTSGTGAGPVVRGVIRLAGPLYGDGAVRAAASVGGEAEVAAAVDEKRSAGGSCGP